MIISLLRMDGHKSFIQSVLQIDPTIPIGLLALNTADNEDAAANLERSLERRQGRSKLPGIFRKKDRAQVYAA